MRKSEQVSMLQFNFYLWYKIFWTSTKFFIPVQIFWNQYKFFNLSQFVDFFVFASNKKIFLAPLIFSSSPFFSLSPLYLPHVLFPPCFPNIPVTILFISMLTCTMWALNHLPLVFLWIHVLMPYHWAMETWMQVPLFFLITYTVEVINFLKLFISDILTNENIPSIITHYYYSKCTSALTIYKLILL